MRRQSFPEREDTVGLTELGLADRLPASRTSVRAALERLRQEGLLEALPTTGFVVREFRLADSWDSIELRGTLDGSAARLATAWPLPGTERCLPPRNVWQLSQSPYAGRHAYSTSGGRRKFARRNCRSLSTPSGESRRHPVAFQDLKIILAHPSFPWQDEASSVRLHKPTVYIDLSGWSPKYFSATLIQDANTLLKHKVLFG